MSWSDIISENAATLIVAASTLSATYLTLRTTRKSDAARLSHEQDMRFLEERIRVANQLVETVISAMAFISDKQFGEAESSKHEGWDFTSIQKLHEYRSRAVALAIQFENQALKDCVADWSDSVGKLSEEVQHLMITKAFDDLDLYAVRRDLGAAWVATGPYATRVYKEVGKMTGASISFPDAEEPLPPTVQPNTTQGS